MQMPWSMLGVGSDAGLLNGTKPITESNGPAVEICITPKRSAWKTDQIVLEYGCPQLTGSAGPPLPGGLNMSACVV